MTYIWSFIIIVSLVFSILSGNVKEINNVILVSSFDALKTFGLISSNIILWSGILEVSVESGMIKYLSFFIKPLVKPLFKTKNEEIIDLISANITCNIFALGSASAPFGIKAMKLLDIENNNSKKESSDMATLVIINACGFTLIPTSLIALRSNYNSELNSLVMFYIILFSFITTVIMLVINKVAKRWI